MSANPVKPAGPFQEKKTVLLIGGVLAAVILIALFLILRGPSPDQIVRNYLDDIRDNPRSTDAQRWISGATFGDVNQDSQRARTLGPQMDLSHFNETDLPGVTFSAGVVSINDEAATVTVNARAGAQLIAVPVHLVWEERGWRIDWEATNREVRAIQEQINAVSTGTAAESPKS